MPDKRTGVSWLIEEITVEIYKRLRRTAHISCYAAVRAPASIGFVLD